MFNNLTKNENGTYTFHWKDWSNGVDETGWCGDETGEPDHEITFNLSDIDYLDVDTNIGYLNTGERIYNICPSEFFFFSLELERHRNELPNYVRIQPGDFDERKISSYFINFDNVEFVLNGNLYDPTKSGYDYGCLVVFRYTKTLLVLNTRADIEYFFDEFNKYHFNTMEKKKLGIPAIPRTESDEEKIKGFANDIEALVSRYGDQYGRVDVKETLTHGNSVNVFLRYDDTIYGHEVISVGFNSLDMPGASITSISGGEYYCNPIDDFPIKTLEVIFEQIKKYHKD